jgi:hypothetical protein
MNDLEATSLRLLIRRLDLIADMDGDHGVDRRGCISSNQLDDRAAVRRMEVDDPAKVESFNAQTEIVLVEVLSARSATERFAVMPVGCIESLLG